MFARTQMRSGGWTSLVAVTGLGLALPLLARALVASHRGSTALVRSLFLYELTLAGLGCVVACIVHRLVPGHSPGPFSTGSLRAPVTPVRLLGLGTGGNVPWRREIVSMTLVITVVTTLFVYPAAHTRFSVDRALAQAPLILLFAALNAAGEEWIYRVALLRAAEGRMSDSWRCALSAGVFGIAHLSGVPGGIAGALAAGILGYVLGRVTLDTRGIATAWCVHLLQDVVIFTVWLGTVS